MKRKILINLIFLIFFIASISWAETAMVFTKTNAIRESPKFFAPVKAMVRYGDILDILNLEEDWYKVKFRNIIGYIHKTAVEKRNIQPTSFSGTQRYTTSDAEITLAGKGFNPQVENAYKNKHPEMKFYLVDRVETYYASDNELIFFIRNGGLLEPR
jgi:hypothetical protein